MTAVGFEPTPLRTGALSQRLRPLGQTVLVFITDETRACMMYIHASVTDRQAARGVGHGSDLTSHPILRATVCLQKLAEHGLDPWTFGL